MGPLGHWMVENGGDMFRQAIADYDEARGFMHGVFLRYYSTLPAFSPSDAELDLAFQVLSNVLLPDEPFAPYLENEYWRDVDPTRSSGPFSYTTKGEHWLRAGNITRRVYSRLIWQQELPQVVAGICDKDEILPIEKLDRTRNFVPPPCWLHFCERLVFGPIADWESTQFENRPIKVGQNIHGGAVHEMFRKHRGRLTFQCDLSAQEYCYRLFVWRFLARLRAAASTVPEVVRVLYEAIVDAFLHHPDGHVYGPTLKNKSGRTLTLHDNGVQVLLLFFLAWSRIRLRDGGDPNAFWSEVGDYLDIYGDNIIVSLDADFVNQYGIESFVAEMWSLGFVLKVEGQAISGHGLTWCGMIYESPSRPLVFAKPMKEVAKLVFSKLQPGMLAQQISGLYLMCYFTPIRPLLAKAADWLETAHGVEVHLFSRQEALQHWGPPTKQCSNPGGELLISMIKFPSENSQSFPFFPQDEFPESCGTMPRKQKFSSVAARKLYPLPRNARVVRKVETEVERKAARPRKAKGSRSMPRRMGGMSSGVKVSKAGAPVKVEFDYRPKYKRKNLKDGCIVEYTDLVMPVQASLFPMVFSQAFSLDLRDQTLQQPGSVMAKLRQEASQWARYQVLDASLVYAPKVGTTVNGGVGIGIVPGEVAAPSSARELATFYGSAYGSIGAMHTTGAWKPREYRLFNTDRAGPDGASQRFPFSVVACTDGATGLPVAPAVGTNVSNPAVDVGELFISVRIRFQDEMPPPSNVLTLYADGYTTKAADVFPVVRWTKLANMIGDFNWNAAGSQYAKVPINGAALPAAAGGTVTTSNTDTGVYPNGQYFDLEPGRYEFNFTSDLAAPAPEGELKSGDAPGWFQIAKPAHDPNVAGDIGWVVLVRDLADAGSLLTSVGQFAFNANFATSNAGCFLSCPITKPSQVCVCFTTNGIARVVNFMRMAIQRVL